MRYHFLLIIEKKIEIFDNMQCQRRCEKADTVYRYITRQGNFAAFLIQNQQESFQHFQQQIKKRGLCPNCQKEPAQGSRIIYHLSSPQNQGSVVDHKRESLRLKYIYLKHASSKLSDVLNAKSVNKKNLSSHIVTYNQVWHFFSFQIPPG